MKHGLMGLALLSLLVLPGLADDLDDLPNPLRDAAVGEWASYTLTSRGGQNMEVPCRIEVASIDSDQVEIKTTIDMTETPMGQKVEQTSSVDRTNSMSEVLKGRARGDDAMAHQMRVRDLEINSSSIDDSEFEHDGKTYATKKITVEMSYEMGASGGPSMAIEMVVVWHLSDEIPVRGILHETVTQKFSSEGADPMAMTASRTLLKFGGGNVETGDE